MTTNELDHVLSTTLHRMQTSSIKGHFFAGATSSEVAAVETHLGLSLPYSYRCFLRLLGCGTFRSQEFFGIVPGQSVFGNGSLLVVDVNMTARQSQNARALPAEWICVAESGNGWCYVLRTDNRVLLDSTNYECPVDSWFFGSDLSTAYPMATTFAEFFARLIDEMIDDK